MRGAVALLVLVLAAPPAALAEPVGVAVIVRPRVATVPPAGQASRDVAVRDVIDRGLRVKLRDRESLLKIAFNRQFGCQNLTLSGERTLSVSGVLTTLGPSDLGMGDPGRPCEARVRFSLGRLWLALAPGEPQVDVETPDTVSGVKGTYARFLVDPVVGTFIAVDEGTVTVQARAGGRPVEVPAGYWVLVPPGGLPRTPALLEPAGPGSGPFPFAGPFTDPPLLDAFDIGTEPPKGN